jgi:hypothetical protein
MAHDYTYLILILFIGGFTGWTLFAVVFNQFLKMKNIQITMIDDIQKDIKYIKSEIKDLK